MKPETLIDQRTRLTKSVRDFVSKIGYPRGSFSYDGMDEHALVDWAIEIEDAAVARVVKDGITET